MPVPHFEHAFQYNQASAANGNPLLNANGLRWGAFAVASGGLNSNQYPWNIMIRMAVVDTVAGGAVTFVIEEAPFPGTVWSAPAAFRGTTGENSFTLTIPSGSLMKALHRNFKLTQPCVRVRVASFTGGAAPAAYVYGSPGYYGT